MAYGLSEINQNGVDYRLNDPNIANEFSTSTAYTEGEYVNYNGLLYLFNVAHPAGAWNASHVTEVTMGNEVTDLKSAIMIGRLTPEIIAALLACFEKVAWIDNNGQDYYSSLYNALYNVNSISAVYTQTNTVYETDNLDVLKTDLVVTVFYPDGSSEIVPPSSYTLSGTLTVGTSLITVSYGGKTTTFNVTVTNLFSDLIFESNTWSTFGAGEYTNYIKKTTASARARVSVPFANNNYAFVVTDATKYNIAAYRVTSLETITVGQTELYPGINNSSVSWDTSVSVDTQYVALAFKKLDNTDFTQNELDNMYGTVFVLG